MGWGDNNFTAIQYVERLKRIAEKLKKLQDLNLDIDKNKLNNLMTAMDSVNKFRERNNTDDLGEKTPITTISSRTSEHRKRAISARYKRRGSINDS